jgi:hypothetical protein
MFLDADVIDTTANPTDSTGNKESIMKGFIYTLGSILLFVIIIVTVRGIVACWKKGRQGYQRLRGGAVREGNDGRVRRERVEVDARMLKEMRMLKEKAIKG